MSGIRSLRDVNLNEKSRLVPNASKANSSILNSGQNSSSPTSARNESFGQMISQTCCPYFSVLSFTLIMTWFQTMVYIWTVFYDYESTTFLQPKLDTLTRFGAKDCTRMRWNHEVWRFVTPMFLHANLWHLLSNMIFQLIIGFRLEPTIGVVRMIGVYTLSAIGGILFSSLVTPDSIAVGASTAIFGLLGAMIAWLFYNWNSVVDNPNRNSVMISLVAISLFNLFIGAASDNVDIAGHIGGFIMGFVSGLALATPVEEKHTEREKMWKYGAMVATGALLFAGLVLFYTVIKVHKQKDEEPVN